MLINGLYIMVRLLVRGMEACQIELNTTIATSIARHAMAAEVATFEPIRLLPEHKLLKVTKLYHN